MSSYIVNYSTMNRVAGYIAYRKDIKLYDNDDKLTKEFRALIKSLWDMNVEALAQRYGEIEKKLNKKYIKEYEFEYEPLPKDDFEKDIPILMKYFKSFCNYTYQCSEGDVTETALYKEVDAFEKELGCKIAYALPEFHKGAWE